MAKYDVHEVMVCRIASEMTEEGDYVTILGSFTPLAYAAYMLAKLTHAPDAWLVGYNAIGMPPVELSFTGSEAAAYRGSLARNSFTPNGHLVHLGTHGLLECVSSAQMDGDGAINLSAIGDYDHPKVRLPGGAGAPEVVQNYRKVVAYFSKHDARTLCAKVDYATGRRTPISRDKREALGLVSGGPVTIVTPLAVLVKEDDERPFAIESVHPGVSVDEVVAATGFAVDVPADVPTTAEPTAEQIDLLRNRIDPLGTVRFDFLSGEERLAYLEEVLAKEWARAEELVRVTAPVG
ncbi:CoA-transferase [Capillimicrobium parvum]|uniref:3-oxoadipate CoA-transferase subunit B n=1 Tax=Capillimicrobium parvum TaxID=2884022 RepID=A0A9E7BZ18_9ACTN|nr:CoA-transferase [Capillimicrobium parvum]UGS34846.1 3-oxoadipate CoA-transferase subunit B [Capillimicrobium parvum]